MIVSCAFCSGQNFVTEERRRVAGMPPRCWKCGAVLAFPPETAFPEGESKGGVAIDDERRSRGDA